MTKYKAESSTTRFEKGDHVYQWCRFAGLPNVYQHHGIVVNVEPTPGTDEETLTICDFSNYRPSKGDAHKEPAKKRRKNQVLEHLCASLVGGGTGGAFRVYKSKKSWHKVEYGATRWQTITSRSGVCTTMEATDPPEVVLQRVNFLLTHSERDATNNAFVSNALPKYHLLFANCECVAMWCKTGQWATLQGASLLAAGAGPSMAVGRTPEGLVTVGTAAQVAATTRGRMGVVTVGPSLLRTARKQPAVAAAGALVVGGSAATLVMVRSRWNATTRELSEAFLARETLESSTKPKAIPSLAGG